MPQSCKTARWVAVAAFTRNCPTKQAEKPENGDSRCVSCQNPMNFLKKGKTKTNLFVSVKSQVLSGAGAGARQEDGGFVIFLGAVLFMMLTCEHDKPNVASDPHCFFNA
jgi:hypothetical protein